MATLQEMIAHLQSRESAGTAGSGGGGARQLVTCSHMREYCNDCREDHRITNAMYKASDAGKPLKPAEMEAIAGAHHATFKRFQRWGARVKGVHHLELGTPLHEALWDEFAATESSDAVPRCGAAGCGNRTMPGGGPLAKCGTCRAIAYCCQECQRLDWAEGHRRACVPAAAAAAAADGGATSSS